MRSLYLLFLILCLEMTAGAQKQCPVYGDATTAKDKALNTAKNKSVKVPANRKPEDLKLNMLINSRKGDDSKRYSNGAYIVTSGYLVSHEEQGPESCNCKLAKASKKNGDVHIYLGLKPDAAKKDCIVIEITPAFKKLHPDYADLLQNHTKITVEGYLFFDEHHKANALTTCRKCTGSAIWRRTCWEIHPVTAIEGA
jgi:hypothetical protein